MDNSAAHRASASQDAQFR